MAGTSPAMTTPSIASKANKAARAFPIQMSNSFEDARPRSRPADAPELFTRSRPQSKRGRRECRATASPVARQQQEKLAAVTTGSARSSGIPCAMVLTLISRSPWGTGLSCPHRPHRSSRCGLSASVGAPGPHDFASASAPFVRTNHRARRQSVHRIPRSRSVTIGHDALFLEAGRAHYTSDLRKTSSSLFLRGGLDRTGQISSDLPVGQP